MDKKKKDEPVTACPNCGSLELNWLGKDMIDSAVIGISGPLSGVYKCDKCGYQGLPLEFDNMKNYLAFMKAKKEGKMDTSMPQEFEAAELEKKPPLAARMIFAHFKIAVAIVIIVTCIYLLFLLIAGK
jgi:hypothetical protein